MNASALAESSEAVRPSAGTDNVSTTASAMRENQFLIGRAYPRPIRAVKLRNVALSCLRARRLCCNSSGTGDAAVSQTLLWRLRHFRPSECRGADVLRTLRAAASGAG